MSDHCGAVYTKGMLPEYEGNPLIEALPPVEDDSAILRSLFSQPMISPDDRMLSPLLRKKCLSRLEALVCPTPTYLDMHRAIEDALLEGYRAKNPFSATTAQWLYYVDGSEAGVFPASGPFKSRARITTVVGESGTGKSTMIESIISRYPQVIEHTNYNGTDLPIRQLVYVIVECPSSASVKALCKAILKSIDSVMGTDYSRMPRGSSVDDYEDEVERAVRNCFVGAIVIDEFQNMSVQRSGGQKGLIAFLLRLVNNSGIPFIPVGTPDVEDLVGKALRTSRRFEAGGVINVRPLDKILWKLFIERLWNYQWTAKVTPLNKELSDELFRLSRGIHDFAIRTFARAQRAAIDAGHELLTSAGLREAFRLETQFSLGLLGCTERPSTANDSDNLSEKPNGISVDDGDETTKSETPRTVPDIDQIQHPEFSNVIERTIESDIRISEIAEPELLRSVISSTNVLRDLELTGCLLGDPLELQDEPTRK